MDEKPSPSSSRNFPAKEYSKYNGPPSKMGIYGRTRTLSLCLKLPPIAPHLKDTIQQYFAKQDFTIYIFRVATSSFKKCSSFYLENQILTKFLQNHNKSKSDISNSPPTPKVNIVPMSLQPAQGGPTGRGATMPANR